MIDPPALYGSASPSSRIIDLENGSSDTNYQDVNRVGL